MANKFHVKISLLRACSRFKVTSHALQCYVWNFSLRPTLTLHRTDDFGSKITVYQKFSAKISWLEKMCAKNKHWDDQQFVQINICRCQKKKISFSCPWGDMFWQIIPQFAFFIPFLTKCKSPTGKRKNNRADFLLIWTKQKGPWIIEQRVITKVCRSNLCGLGSYLSLIADVHQRCDKM